MMKNIFGEALGLIAPWFISRLNFDVEKRRLDIYIDFKKSSKFDYIEENDNIKGSFPVHDTIQKSWRHLNFFEHECYLNCRVPSVSLLENCQLFHYSNL